MLAHTTILPLLFTSDVASSYQCQPGLSGVMGFLAFIPSESRLFFFLVLIS